MRYEKLLQKRDKLQKELDNITQLLQDYII